MRIAQSVRFSLLVAVALAAGCRFASWKSPISRSLVLSRQLSKQGAVAIETGQWQQARSKLEQAVRTCPTDPDAHRQYAESLWHDGQYELAIRELEESNRLSGETAEIYAALAAKHLAVGQLETAREKAEKSLDLDPKLAQAWFIRGRVGRALGQSRAALADYHHALALSPDDREVLFEIAEAHRELDEPLRALAALERLRGSFPPGEEPQQVIYLEGLALGALGRHDDAADRLAKAVARETPNADLYYELAQAQWRAGRPVDADRSLREALSIAPEHAGCRELSARLAASLSAGQTVLR